MNMEIATKDNTTPYKIIKLISGEDIFCKILQEYTDAIVVECPMSINRHQVMDTTDNVVEHTGLQRWMNFTHDTSFVIDKQKIIGFGNLAPEVVVYYKMVSRKVKAEEDGTTGDDEHDALVNQMRENVSKLEAILEDNDIEDNDKITHLQPNKTLH
tara:strand:- start:30 stop:497 length:468 start_codon:yes stop_codon:yes gene_type:complete